MSRGAARRKKMFFYKKKKLSQFTPFPTHISPPLSYFAQITIQRLPEAEGPSRTPLPARLGPHFQLPICRTPPQPHRLLCIPPLLPSLSRSEARGSALCSGLRANHPEQKGLPNHLPESGTPLPSPGQFLSSQLALACYTVLLIA